MINFVFCLLCVVGGQGGGGAKAIYIATAPYLVLVVLPYAYRVLTGSWQVLLLRGGPLPISTRTSAEPHTAVAQIFCVSVEDY